MQNELKEPTFAMHRSPPQRLRLASADVPASALATPAMMSCDFTLDETLKIAEKENLLPDRGGKPVPFPVALAAGNAAAASVALARRFAVLSAGGSIDPHQ